MHNTEYEALKLMSKNATHIIKDYFKSLTSPDSTAVKNPSSNPVLAKSSVESDSEFEDNVLKSNKRKIKEEPFTDKKKKKKDDSGFASHIE